MKNNNIKTGISIVFGLFVLIVAALPVLAADANFTIDGYVNSSLGMQNETNVSLYRTVGMELVSQVVTDQNGYYNLAVSNETGAFTLVANKTGFDPHSKNTFIPATDAYVSVNFTLGPEQTWLVSGTVTDSETGNPLENVSVIARITGDGIIATDVTNETGDYELTVLDNRNYQFSFEKNKYYSNTTASQLITADTPLDLIMDKIPTTGRFNGTITDQNGNPVSGATVSFMLASTTIPVNSTTTNDSGVYSINIYQETFTNIYDIEVINSPYVGNKIYNVSLTNGQTTPQNIVMTKTVSVNGTTAQAASTVKLFQAGVEKYSGTSASGVYTIQGVVPGIYNVTVVSTDNCYSGSNNSMEIFYASDPNTLSQISTSQVGCFPSLGGSSSGSTYTGGSSFDVPVDMTATTSHSYSWTTLEANKQTGIVFANMAVRQITFELSQEAKDAEIRVEKNDEKPSGLPTPKETAYAFLKIDTKNINKDNLKYVKFNFEVKNDWMNSNKANPESIKLLRLVDNNWVELSTKKTAQASDYSYYEAQSPGLSYFAIVAGSASPATTTPTTTITNPSGNEVVVTPGSATTPATTTTGDVPAITGNVPGASGEQGKPIVAYIIIGLLIAAAIVAAVYYTRSGKGKKK